MLLIHSAKQRLQQINERPTNMSLGIFQLLSRSEASRLIEMRPRDSEKSFAVSSIPVVQ